MLLDTGLFIGVMPVYYILPIYFFIFIFLHVFLGLYRKDNEMMSLLLTAVLSLHMPGWICWML